MPRILIIRFSSIGDIVLTTPVIRCVKKQLPQAEVHVLTKKQYASVLAGNPYIDKLHLHAESLSATIQLLQQENYDYVIDLHHNMRTLRVKMALGVKSFAFNKLNAQKWLLTALKINRLPEVHIVDRYMDTVAPLGIINDGAGLDFFIPAHEALPPGHLAAPWQQGYAGLVIGAALATKQLPLEKLEELCGQLHMPVVLLGGREDTEAGAWLARKHPHVHNACGAHTLAQSAQLVQEARLIITHDTGLMHIAAAFGKPIISIWGNTVPAFGMGPYYGNNPPAMQQIFEVNGLGCRPCSKIGYKKCPQKHFNCMQQQPVAQIAALANGFFNQHFTG